MQPRKVYHSSGELFAPLCRFSYEDLFEYPELNLAKTEERQWLQQFASTVSYTQEMYSASHCQRH